MKPANAATLALLSAGQYIIYHLYKISLASGPVLYVANSDFPLTIGGQLYGGGLIINRSGFTQTNDLTAQRLTLTISPVFDIPGGPPTVGGYAFLAAARQGLFDGATVVWSKLFLPIPTPSNYFNWPDLVTYAPVPWLTGIVNDAQAGRSKAVLQVDTTTVLLNVQMPKNLIQSGCSHMLYDAGCTLSKATFRVSGAVSGTPGVLSFNTGLTQADSYFDLGVITFTSGVNNGLSRTVRTYLHASGAVKILLPLPQAPTAGDTFTILPGCDKQQATCSGKFANLIHFRGLPYVPVPETIYDGGTVSGPATTKGSHLGGVTGSATGGLGRGGTYRP